MSKKTISQKTQASGANSVVRGNPKGGPKRGAKGNWPASGATPELTTMKPPLP